MQAHGPCWKGAYDSTHYSCWSGCMQQAQRLWYAALDDFVVLLTLPRAGEPHTLLTLAKQQRRRKTCT